jgi:hypothetical protein
LSKQAQLLLREGEQEMNEAQKIPVNRCFGGQSPPDQQQTKEEKVKKLLLTAGQRKLANNAIRTLVNERHCRLSALLEMMELWVAHKRLSLFVFEVLIERVEAQRSRHELKFDEIVELEKAKASPVRQLNQ